MNNLFMASFIDIYGVEHSSAICLISNISVDDLLNVRYSVRYWHSNETKNNNHVSQQFLFDDGASFADLPSEELISSNGECNIHEQCKINFMRKIAVQKAHG